MWFDKPGLQTRGIQRGPVAGVSLILCILTSYTIGEAFPGVVTGVGDGAIWLVGGDSVVEPHKGGVLCDGGTADESSSERYPLR